MKNKFIGWIGGILLLTLFSCGKKKIERTYFRTYELNPSYTGTHPKAGVSATVYIIEKSGYLQFQLSMNGISDTLNYVLHVHQQDSTEPFGYTGNPVYDLGNLGNGKVVRTTELSGVDFDSFTQNFKGYFIVHDPFNVQNDTTTLLIYGKIGSDW
ncbi:MAG TPA: hypothetical protein PLP34_03480 [Chitinophagaceae bacterium]|nr:hypothetical protein [Chitinophagaceae bacterium]HNF71448.1 hypothetical protein [Chitinophagaceae bacterium]